MSGSESTFCPLTTWLASFQVPTKGSAAQARAVDKRMRSMAVRTITNAILRRIAPPKMGWAKFRKLPLYGNVCGDCLLDAGGLLLWSSHNTFRHDFRLKPRFRKHGVNHKARDETVDGGGLKVGFGFFGNREEWQDTDHEADGPSTIAGEIDSFSRPGPFLPRQPVVGSHSSANRSEGCTNDGEQASQVLRDTSEGKYGRYYRADHSGRDSRHTWNHGRQAVSRNKRRKAHGSDGRDGEQEKRSGSETPSLGDGRLELIVLGAE